MHGWHPSSGAARKPSSKPARAVNIPAKLWGDQALVLQRGWGVPVLCPHPQTARPCRASVSPLHHGLAPTTQGPAGGCWGPGLCGWQWSGRAAALQAALLG